MAAIEIPVPPSGDGVSVDVSSLPGPKTLIFVGTSGDDSVYIDASFDGVHWARLTQLTGRTMETRTDAFDFVRAVRAFGDGTCDLRIDKLGVPEGSPGAAATVAVGTTTTLAAGSPATVANVGTAQAAVFNFGIPEGDEGTAGTAATVAVGTTTTLAAGSPATVANVGTAQAAVFNFGIPQGQPGANGTNAAVIKTGPTSSNVDQTVATTSETVLTTFSATPTGSKLRLTVQLNATLGNNVNVTFRLKQGSTLIDVVSVHGHSGTPLAGDKLLGFAIGLTPGVAVTFTVTAQLNTGTMTLFPVTLPNDHTFTWTAEDVQ